MNKRGFLFLVLLLLGVGVMAGAPGSKDIIRKAGVAPPASALTPASVLPPAETLSAGPCILNPSFECMGYEGPYGWGVYWGEDPNMEDYEEQDVWVDYSDSDEYRTDGIAGVVLSFYGDVGNYCSTGYGPSIHSTPFTASAGTMVSADWWVDEYGDCPVGRGYVRDAYTDIIVATLFDDSDAPICQIEDNAPSPRAASPYFTTATATIPRNGTFYFDFQVASQDGSCGGAVGAQLHVDNIQISSGTSFLDERGTSKLCLNLSTGAWTWTVLKGTGAGQSFSSVGIIQKSSAGFVLYSKPMDLYWVLKLQFLSGSNRAYGYFRYPQKTIYSNLTDYNTTNNPPNVCGCTYTCPPMPR